MAGSLKGLVVLLFLSFCFAIANLAEAKNTVTIKDMAGRQVVIPDKVQRIVALSSTLRFVVYLKGIDKVAGIEAAEKKEINNAGRPYMATLRGRAEKIPIVGEGGAGRLPDFEKLIAISPQVIFTTSVDPAQADMIQQKTNIPVVVVSYGGVGVVDIEAVIGSLNLMGRIIGAEKRANELRDYIRTTLKDLMKRTETISSNKKTNVYVGGVSYRGAHGITSTQAFYPPLEWINAKNIANYIQKQGPVFIDREQLLLWNPDILFIDTNSFNLIYDDYKKDPFFYSKLKAIQTGHVYSTLPYNNYFTNIELAFCNAYFMGKILYPERFKDIVPARKSDDIINFFIGILLYKEIKDQLKGFGRVTISAEGISIK